MNIDDLRRSMVAALTARGLRRVAEHRHPDGVDLVLEAYLLPDAPRRVVARLTAAEADVSQLDDLAHAAAAEGYVDFVLVSESAVSAIEHDARVLAGERLQKVLRDTWLTADIDGAGATIDREGLRLLSRIDNARAIELRPLLRGILALSRNRVSPELVGLGAADDLFERYAFSLLTGPLGLFGVRFGSASKGQRVGDALVGMSDCEKPAVLDCKAAAAGYLMDIADERKLIEYASKDIEWGNYVGKPAGVVVLSSTFQGSRAQVHPYKARRKSFVAIGSDLWYVRADDLVSAVLAIPAEVWNDTDRLRSIDWAAALDGGVVTRSALLQVVQEA